MQKEERKEIQISHKGVLSQAGKSFIQPLIGLNNDKPEWEKGVAQNFLNHLNLIRGIFFQRQETFLSLAIWMMRIKNQLKKEKEEEGIKKAEGKEQFPIQKKNILFLEGPFLSHN